MRIVQLPEQAELPKNSLFLMNKKNKEQPPSPSNTNSITNANNSMIAQGQGQGQGFGDGDEQIVEWKEDETCIQLCIRMPGVRAKDVQVSMEQEGVLSICGHHQSSRDRSKRQRLGSREFDVDTQRINIQRAIITLWGDMLILYAPKKCQSVPMSSRFTQEDLLSYC
jgi:HSP20 family molecular chaperone IbpA